jgi:hypothetical protein
MNQYSSGARNAAYALITGSLIWLVWPSSDAPAQEAAAPTASTPSAPPTRRDRRRAAQAQTAAAPAAMPAAAPTASAAPAASTAPAAATAPAAVPAAAAEAEAEGPTQICKNIKPLGTRMAKRVCGTPEQWAALEKKTTDAASDDMRQVRTIGGVIATAPGPTTP